MGGKGTRSGDVLEDATTVLLLAPAIRDTGTSAAATLLERGSQPLDRVVGVTITQSAGGWIDAWNRNADPSTQVSCINVDGKTRSVVGVEGGCTATSVKQVDDPSDLETLGRTVSRVLERASDNGERIGLAIHSVSDLLHHVEEPTVFKFVYTLGEVVRRVDGSVYFHMDAEAHDDETIDTFAATCDAIVELDQDVTITAQNDW